MGTGDDTGVYKISDSVAIVQTVDFFTPIVDDPYTFGRIAAANAISDVYTVGARPITALNIIAVSCSLGIEVINEILKGGADTVREAGAVLLGGHSIEDPEPKYGLAVTGVVHPDRMVTNRGARPGDVLILTKKIGVGILSNLAKVKGTIKGSIMMRGPAIPDSVFAEAEREMTRLNRNASEAMVEFGVRACTDVTGFGLLGHLRNLLEASGVSATISFSRVPRYDGIGPYAVNGTKGGGERNHNWVKPIVTAGEGIAGVEILILCDAQTSGGLLMAVPEEKAERLLARLKNGGDEAASVIGEINPGPPGSVTVTP